MHIEVTAPRFCAPANGCYHRTALIKDKIKVPSKAIGLWNPPEEELTNRPGNVSILSANNTGDN